MLPAAKKTELLMQPDACFVICSDLSLRETESVFRGVSVCLRKRRESIPSAAERRKYLGSGGYYISAMLIKVDGTNDSFIRSDDKEPVPVTVDLIRRESFRVGGCKLRKARQKKRKIGCSEADQRYI